MTGRVGRPPYRVVSAYEDFLEAFRQAIEDANGQVIFPDVPLASCFTESGKGATVAFKRCLYLKDCPCRKLPHGKRLDVAIMALEEITGPAWLLTRSTVYLNYFVVSNSKAHLAQSLHYDFLEGGQADHPFFHVQLTGEPIPENDLRSIGFDVELKLAEQSDECSVTTRIPTPDMSLASVLYCLVADHWGTGVFSQFAERADSLQDR